MTTIEPTRCEGCRSEDEGCTDNYWPDLGWCCEQCRDGAEWEYYHGDEDED